MIQMTINRVLNYLCIIIHYYNGSPKPPPPGVPKVIMLPGEITDKIKGSVQDNSSLAEKAKQKLSGFKFKK